MNKADVSRFFATVGAALLIVALFVIGIPHVLLEEGGLFWAVAGITGFAISFAIDHWPSKSAAPPAPRPIA